MNRKQVTVSPQTHAALSLLKSLTGNSIGEIIDQLVIHYVSEMTGSPTTETSAPPTVASSLQLPARRKDTPL